MMVPKILKGVTLIAQEIKVFGHAKEVVSPQHPNVIFGGTGFEKLPKPATTD